MSKSRAWIFPKQCHLILEVLDIPTSGRPDVRDKSTPRRSDVKTSGTSAHPDIRTSARSDVRTSRRQDVWKSGSKSRVWIFPKQCHLILEVLDVHQASPDARVAMGY